MDIGKQAKDKDMAHSKEQQEILINSSKTILTSTVQMAAATTGVAMVGNSRQSNGINIALDSAETSKI